MSRQPRSASDVLRSMGDLDRELLKALEQYLEQQAEAPVDHQTFIAGYPQLADQLPSLLASIDALGGLCPVTDRSTIDWDSMTGFRDLTSKTVGDYEIVREVGRGGMGIVYEARQVSLDRQVALKVLPLTVVLDEKQIARFTVEAQAAAQLHHPNIVPIFSVGCEDGLHCYSMALIDGVSLDRWIVEHNSNQRGSSSTSKSSRDSNRATADWALQAARALDHAHDRGVIHRDIKPSNLILDRNGKIWVTDFGLARCRSDSSLTQSGAIVGTLRYMSPEQGSGRPHRVDHRSDIYSLGITLYELVTGVPAWDPELRNQWVSERETCLPRAPRRVNPRMSRDLETIILKSIAVDPSHRYPSAGEMADDLQRYLDGEPIRARRPSIADRMAKWTARYRKTVAAAAAVGLVMLVASLITTAKFATKQTELTEAITQARENEDRSNENFRRTREVLDHFGLLAAERLRGVAGAESIRQELVHDLLKYYEEFAVTASNSPELREELARTHFRAARIIEEAGAVTQAIDAYQRSLQLYDELLQQPITPPLNAEFQFYVALCHNNMGLLYAELRETERAERHYRSAMSIHSDLIDIHAKAGRELANTHGNLGLLWSGVGETKRAESELETSLTLLKSLEPSHGTGSDVHLAIAMTLNNLGYLFQDSDYERALQYNQEAIALLRRQAEVNDSLSVHPLATSLNNQAALLAKQRRLPESLAMYAESLTLYRDLVERAPLVRQYTEELAITYNNFGRMLTRAGNYGDARMSLMRARDLMQLLLRRQPSEPRYHASLGGVLNNLAKVSVQAGDYGDAIEQYKDSIAQQNKLRELVDDTSDYRGMLATTYEGYESALRRSGRTLEAEQVKVIRRRL